MSILSLATINHLERDLNETQLMINGARSLTSDMDFQIQLDLMQIRVDENREMIEAMKIAIPMSN
jgi:hypothetical protein